MLPRRERVPCEWSNLLLDENGPNQVWFWRGWLPLPRHTEHLANQPQVSSIFAHNIYFSASLRGRHNILIQGRPSGRDP